MARSGSTGNRRKQAHTVPTVIITNLHPRFDVFYKPMLRGVGADVMVY